MPENWIYRRGDIYLATIIKENRLECTMKKKIHTKVFGISGLARYASQQGYSISTYLIKKAIKDGQLPCRIVGKAYLITWENFEEWISCRSCPPELKGGMACANHRSKKE